MRALSLVDHMGPKYSERMSRFSFINCLLHLQPVHFLDQEERF
jgi:hypothetical protein